MSVQIYAIGEKQRFQRNMEEDYTGDDTQGVHCEG